MSKSYRLGGPAVGSKSPRLRKEPQSNRSCMLRIGERLMRAGSEGNLVERPIPVQSRSEASSSRLAQGPNGRTQPTNLEDKPTEHTEDNSSKEKSPSKVSSSSSSPAVDSCTERLLQKKPYPNSSPLCHPEPPSGGAAPRSPSTLPRSHITAARATAGRDSQLVSLEAQHSEVERKKDVFLDHLRQKYPHHAAIIMGHQGRKGEQ
ncbi:hypothetical protein JOQ06_001173, partial [Pogonophryne albipinna]